MDIGHLLATLVGVTPSAAQTPPPQMQSPPALQPTPVQATPVAQPAPVVNNEEIGIAGDRWKPRERKPLETIADLLIGAPIFTRHIKRENEESAMQGFDEKPLRSIRRMAKIDPKTAWVMFNQYHDNQIQDQIQARADHQQKEGRVFGTLQALNPNTYDAARPKLQKYIDDNQLDIELPDKYDPDAIRGVVLGGMDAQKQLGIQDANRYRTLRAKQFQEQIMDNHEYKQTRERQLQQSVDQQGSHYKAMEGIDQQKANRYNNAPLPMPNTPKPGQRLLSDDKSKISEFRADGKWHVFSRPDGEHVQEIGTISKGSDGKWYKD
jgi:hypothetical protein